MQKNNRGFSLVELIIVIAIMAILVGVMAPQLIKYIEKTNVSADLQLCDSVQEAIIISANDPTILEAEDKSAEMIADMFDPTNSGTILARYSGDWLTCEFCKSVVEILGFNPFDIHGNSDDMLKSSAKRNNGGLMQCTNDEGTYMTVYVQHSDKTGKKQDKTYNGKVDGLEASGVIYAE